MKNRALALTSMAIVSLTAAACQAHANWTETFLVPAGSVNSYAYATDGSLEAGQAFFGGEIINGITYNAQPSAGIWNGTASSWVNLNPVGADFSYAVALSGTTEAGQADFNGQLDAGIWTSSASSWVNLNPTGASTSYAQAIYGNTEGGYASFDGGQTLNAGIWSGTASSWVNLAPAGALISNVTGIFGNSEVGDVAFEIDNGLFIGCASLWTGSSTSWIDLNPAGAYGAAAYAISGNTEVGWEYDEHFHDNAGMWHGSASTWIDLKPAGSTESNAWAVYGDVEAGSATFNGNETAGIWRGSASSWQALPTTNTWSDAYGVWSSGQNTYVVGHDGGQAVIWSTRNTNAVPAPGGFVVFATGVAARLRRRRNTR